MNEEIRYSSPSKINTSLSANLSGSAYFMHFDYAAKLAERKAPFDIFAEIIDGLGEIIIAGKSNLLTKGESIVIPALKSHIIHAKGRFKILLTILKQDFVQEKDPA